mmetsp:Transcript_74715/g.178260  ORF Transcript_74715/g.178260 Transcript_74715/m.178260 type:complete len:203 (-) Transcript_74715:1237-1845(-)
MPDVQDPLLRVLTGVRLPRRMSGAGAGGDPEALSARFPASRPAVPCVRLWFASSLRASAKSIFFVPELPLTNFGEFQSGSPSVAKGPPDCSGPTRQPKDEDRFGAFPGERRSVSVLRLPLLLVGVDLDGFRSGIDGLTATFASAAIAWWDTRASPPSATGNSCISEHTGAILVQGGELAGPMLPSDGPWASDTPSTLPHSDS